MTGDIYWLGPCPAEEQPAQSAHPDFHERNKAECLAYIEAIKRVCGDPPDGAVLRIKSQPHDFTSYREVVIEFDGENAEAAAYAQKVDETRPTTWAEAGMSDPLKPVEPTTKRYVGVRTPEGCVVTVHDEDANAAYPLDPRFDLRNHSPSGFEYGFAGSGPAQLSLALLADATGDDRLAQRHYQTFKRNVIARIADDEFELTADSIRQAVAAIEAGRGR